MMSAALTVAVLVAFAVLLAYVAAVPVRRRRAELDEWHDAEVERAAYLHGLARATVAARAELTGAAPDDAARAIVDQRQLRRAFDVGAARNRLPPELRRRR